MKRMMWLSLSLLLFACSDGEDPSNEELTEEIEDEGNNDESDLNIPEEIDPDDENSEKEEGESEDNSNPNDPDNQEDGEKSPDESANQDEWIDYDQLLTEVVEEFADRVPNTWGENVEGVVTQIDTDDRIVSLTFDACDATPNSFDQELIDFLTAEEIPATLFINARWIREHTEIFMDLVENPLFELANHGHEHSPLSVSGESAYGIAGTESVEEVFDEIVENQKLFYELTGQYPEYFRSGTAFYDEVAVEIIEFLNLTAVNYNVLGDAGATFTHEQIVQTFENVQPGSIFLFHMNQPDSEVSSGVIEGVQFLQEQGYEFVQVGDYAEDLF